MTLDQLKDINCALATGLAAQQELARQRQEKAKPAGNARALSPEEQVVDGRLAQAITDRVRTPADKAKQATARANELARAHGWPEVR